MKSKEELIQELVSLYGKDGNFAWSLETLKKCNENQIRTLYSACLNDKGVLRKPE